MKGVIIETPGAPYKAVADIEKPKPNADQILVKSIATAINPVDTLMISGLLVSSFPIVLGCDSSGVVVEVGKDAESLFKVGDRVCGCTRLGEPGYGTFQEYFLMDARLAIPAPKKLSFQQAASLGVGTETASMGLFSGFKIKLPEAKALPEVKDEWVVILGGAGSVGQYAVQVSSSQADQRYLVVSHDDSIIQLAKLSGYKVVATCSAKTASLVTSLGADATIDYRKSDNDQIEDLKSITSGNFFAIYDTVAKSTALALKALNEASTLDKKFFATTDDWSPLDETPGVSIYRVRLGLIGKSGEAIAKEPSFNDDLASYIPVIYQLLEDGKLQPNEVSVMEEGGFEGVADAVATQQKAQGGGGKVVITLQEE